MAGTVPLRAAAGAAAVVVAACAGAGAVFGGYAPLHQGLAVLGGLALAQVLLRHCVRRFGGVTGDVFGAVAEVAATGVLVGLALG